MEGFRDHLNSNLGTSKHAAAETQTHLYSRYIYIYTIYNIYIYIYITIYIYIYIYIVLVRRISLSPASQEVTNWNPTLKQLVVKFQQPWSPRWKFTNQTIIGYIPIRSPLRMVKSLYVSWILLVKFLCLLVNTVNHLKPNAIWDGTRKTIISSSEVETVDLDHMPLDSKCLTIFLS